MQWEMKQKTNCKFQSDTWNVSETLIRDQIIIGVSDKDFWKKALKEEWTLQQLEDNGKRTEAAALGANVKVSNIAGKYSKKYWNKENLYATKKVNQSESHTKDSFMCFVVVDITATRTTTQQKNRFAIYAKARDTGLDR